MKNDGSEKNTSQGQSPGKLDRYAWFDQGKNLKRILSPSLGDLGVAALAILLAFVLVGFLIWIIGINPLHAYRELLRGSLGTRNGIAETLVRTAPLLLAGLGITVAFRCGIWNIGAEGQIYMGALGAAIAGLYLPTLPAGIHIVLVILCGFLFGMLWGGLVGLFRAYLGANEIIITIMMNYLAIFLVGYLVSGPMKDPNNLIPQPQTAKIAASAVLPGILSATRAHAGIIMALVFVVLVWVFLKYTTLGYEIRSAGSNSWAAAHGGINVPFTIFLAMAISGGLAGLAGVGEVAGLQHYLIPDISPGYGNLAIAVALSGGLNPIGVSLAALFFGILMVGAESMQRAMGVPQSLIYIIQGLVIIFVLARRVLRKS